MGNKIGWLCSIALLVGTWKITNFSFQSRVNKELGFYVFSNFNQLVIVERNKNKPKGPKFRRYLIFSVLYKFYWGYKASKNMKSLSFLQTTFKKDFFWQNYFVKNINLFPPLFLSITSDFGFFSPWVRSFCNNFLWDTLRPNLHEKNVIKTRGQPSTFIINPDFSSDQWNKMFKRMDYYPSRLDFLKGVYLFCFYFLQKFWKIMKIWFLEIQSFSPWVFKKDSKIYRIVYFVQLFMKKAKKYLNVSLILCISSTNCEIFLKE